MFSFKAGRNRLQQMQELHDARQREKEEYEERIAQLEDELTETQEQLDEYNGVQLLTEPTIVEVATPEIEIEEEVEEIVEAPKPKKKAKAKKKKFGLFG